MWTCDSAISDKIFYPNAPGRGADSGIRRIWELPLLIVSSCIKSSCFKLCRKTEAFRSHSWEVVSSPHRVFVMYLALKHTVFLRVSQNIADSMSVWLGL